MTEITNPVALTPEQAEKFGGIGILRMFEKIAHATFSNYSVNFVKMRYHTTFSAFTEKMFVVKSALLAKNLEIISQLREQGMSALKTSGGYILFMLANNNLHIDFVTEAEFNVFASEDELDGLIIIA